MSINVRACVRACVFTADARAALRYVDADHEVETVTEADHVQVVHIGAQLCRVLLVVHQSLDGLALRLEVGVGNAQLGLGVRQSTPQCSVLLNHLACLHHTGTTHRQNRSRRYSNNRKMAAGK